MKRKMKGVRWKPHRQRWAVEFRVETKMRYFGQFRTYCEAVQRASEIWPTLPIAKRKIKTCDACGKRGVVPHEFEYKNKSCRECKASRRECIWIRWSMQEIATIKKKQRRDSRRTGWVKWAADKQIGILNRIEQFSSASVIKTQRGGLSWEEWIVTALVENRRRWAWSQKNEWDRKIKQWVRSLIRREKRRLRMN